MNGTDNYGDMMNLAAQQMQFSIEQQQKKKADAFKKRIEEFKHIKTIDEARELAKKIMPVSNEKTRFRIGNARCVIINRADMFRITIDTEKEFISYDFV